MSFLAASLAAFSLLLFGGCGGGTSANVVTVTVTPSTVLILGASQTMTATVGGTSMTNVTWSPLQYTTTPAGGKTSKPIAAPSDGSFGTLTNTQATGTATYTAPDPSKFQLPDQTKFPNLQIVVTATSVANPNKSGSASITLISGIRAGLTPETASVPTKENQQFFVTLTNDVQNKGVKWLVTQNVPSTTNGVTTTFPELPTCSPSCGTITPDSNNPNVAIYTAPDTVPTAITPAQKNNTNAPADLTIVATPVADNSGVVIGTITVVAGGPITFNGVSPSIAPQGATFWDLYLDAPNISSASKITFNYEDASNNVIGTKTFDSSLGQIKVLFPIPTTTTSGSTTTTTTPTSTGARLRLKDQDLVNPPGAAKVVLTVTDPGEPVTPSSLPPPAQAGPFTFTFVPVRPTSIASVPDDIVQNTQAQGTQVLIDGGYFGPSGNFAEIVFQGNAIASDPTQSTSRRFVTSIPSGDTTGISPGLYPLSIEGRPPLPNPGPPAVTNISIFPDYSTAGPFIAGASPTAVLGQNPSAVDLDPTLGVLAVADTGSNQVEFFSIGRGSLTSLGAVSSTPAAPLNLPTGLSINRNNHTVAVVNFGSQTITKNADGTCKQTVPTGQSVTVLNIPGNPAPITPFSVDLTGALQGSVCPAPMPYSLGVDPNSGLALVAYSATSVSSVMNVGFIVNLNANSAGSSGSLQNPCALGLSINPSSNQFGQCLYSQVTLNTGAYPRIAVAPQGHLAFVTPGGSGVVRGVDVTKPSNANVILSSTLAAGLVTVTIDSTKCVTPPNPTSTTNPCPFSMVPGSLGTALLTGVTPGNTANTSFFNGTYTVNVTSGNSFTYVVNSTATDSAKGGAVFYGGPDLQFSISSTLQGVAINPITSTAAMADANATGTNGPQIDLLSALDQSPSSISFLAGCTAFSNPCSSAPELLATTEVAWQPYTNALVSYNPQQKIVSVSDPVSRQRYAIVNVHGPSAVPLAVNNGTTGTLTLWGGLAVDPSTNQAFVVESGQAANPNATPPVSALPGQVEIVDLGPIKPTHISKIVVPSSTAGQVGGIPNASVPEATLTCVIPTPPAATCDLPGVQIFGSGFVSPLQVRLDGVDITTISGGAVTNIAANGREVDVTIPHSLLQAPHDFSLDILSNGVPSNSVDFIVIQQVDMSKICPNMKDANGNPVPTQPTSVAIADQLASGPFSPIAVVSNQGCNSISVIDFNPTVTMNGVTMPNPTFGSILSTTPVGTAPQGVAISQRRGLVVVANHGSNTASIIDLTKNPPAALVPDVSTGTAPIGVAVNDPTGVAITANNGSNTITLLNFALLFPPAGTTPPTTLTPISIGGIQRPFAVAIDPDRGTNNQGIAVVTSEQLVSGAAPTGALAVVEIGLQTPTLSTTIPSGSVTGTPTGIVFDPSVVTNTPNPGVFYANSSGANVITEFNPDSGGGSSVSVGINPTSLAINPQTGAILTSNFASNTVSIVDTLSTPFKTRNTLGIPGSPTLGVAIDQFTNLALMVDQANNRLLLFPMPH